MGKRNLFECPKKEEAFTFRNYFTNGDAEKIFKPS